MLWNYSNRLRALLAELSMAASMSGPGPSVWTGRALQAENDDLKKVGLALLYPASHDGVSVKG